MLITVSHNPKTFHLLLFITINEGSLGCGKLCLRKVKHFGFTFLNAKPKCLLFMYEEWNDEQKSYWFSSIWVINYSMKRAVVAALVLTFVFMAAVRLVWLVVAVWVTVAHRHRQQTAAAVAHKLFSGAALWENTKRTHTDAHEHKWSWMWGSMYLQTHTGN